MRSEESSLIKAVAAEIDLGTARLDVYMLPSGEKRIGIENTGIALGYTERWLYDRTKREKSLKVLRDAGFTNDQVWASVLGQGITPTQPYLVKTISRRDFVKLLIFEAGRFNSKALTLLAAFAEVGLEKIIDDVFAGQSTDFFLEKTLHYSEWTSEDLESALSDNREDARSLYWGRR